MLRPLLPVIVLAAVTLPLRPEAQTSVSVDPKLYQDLKWRSIGPHRGGRVTAIAGVRSKPCTFYMGPTGGGIWKTETCGNLWTPISDGQIATGSIGAIDVSESNPDVIYVGTGSAAIRSNVIIGRGMYKSTDAGRTWQFIGLKDAGQIGSVIVHPSNPDVVLIAALGSPFGPNAERGIFKTTDGGKNWKKTLFVNNQTGGRVLAINYSNPNELYAGMYRGLRLGWNIISGGPATEGGIYKSTDGGETWNKLSAGLPQKLIGKIDLDVARSNPRVVYAMVEAPGPEGGLYKSDDSGATWRNVNNSARLRARPFYFHYVDVNPKNENEVWVNELALHKSTDSGKTFTQVPTPHGDNHGIWFNPDNPSIALQCNDGGANVTLDGGRSWSSILNQASAELYMVAVDEQFPYRLYAPQQDNSTVIVPSLPPHSWGYDNAAQAWTQGPGCETGQIHPRPDGSVIWGACKGEVGRYNVATGQEKHTWIYPQNRYGHDPDDIKYRFPRQTVIHVSPHDPKTVYQASHVVHRTTDEGVTWTTISPDLTAREPDKQIVPGSPITRDITGEEVYSSIYSMVESRLERGVLWVGANDGPVHVSRDNGKTWTNVTPKDLPPGGRVQNIEDSPHRKGSAYIAVYRFLREHDLKPYIYVTNDYGKTWSKLTDGANGIPIDHPTRVVREDPDRQGLIYAGTEFGFFVSFDNGRRWQSLQQNLPATPVTDIRVHHKDLVVATMGRSFWIMDNVTPLQQLAGATSFTSEPNGNGSRGGNGSGGASPQAGGSVHRLFTPAVAWRTRHAASGGSPDVPEYPGPGARIDYLFAGPQSGDVKLEILDAKGTVIRTIEPPSATPQGAGQGMRGFRRGGPVAALGTKDGHNRYVWDLRQSAADGPMVAPGKYQVRLTAGSWSDTKPLEVKIDPRVTADGVTQADLEEQTAFLLKVRDATAEARNLSASLKESRKDLYDKLVTAEGPYPQPMLIDQLSNIARMVGQADQKIGKEAQTRFDDLMKELAQIKEAAK
jgi:photosystem II stability/assembly factor-like uncharacterized protein